MTDTAARGTRALWLVHPLVDLLVGCGAWTLPLLALALMFSEGGQVNALIVLGVLLLICNWPHYAATWHRAHAAGIATPRQREAAKLLAAGFAVVVLFLFMNPRFLPWAFTVYLLWSPWHYSSQNFGIAQLLLRRSGAPADPWARRMLLGGFVGSYLVWLVPVLAIPPEHPLLLTPGLEHTAAANATMLLLAATVMAFAAGAWRIRRTVGWHGAVPVLTLISTQALWFGLPAVQLLRGAPMTTALALYATALFAFMHCAQYLWITGWAARRSAGGGFSLPRWWMGMAALGVVLFLVLPWGLSVTVGYDLATGLLIMQAAVNLHHFALDAVVWKLRDPAVSSLLVTEATTATVPPQSAWLLGPAIGARLVRWGGGLILATVAIADVTQSWALSAPSDDRRLGVAAALSAHDARLHRARAKLLRDADKPVDAVLAGMDALALEPHSVATHLLLAELHCNLGNQQQALPHFEEAERYGQIPPHLLARYGMAAGLAGEQARAITLFRRALTYDPHLAEARLGLGESLLLSGRAGEAVAELGSFLAAPGPAPAEMLVRARWRLADAFAADGKPDLALKEREAAKRHAEAAGLSTVIQELEHQR